MDVREQNKIIANCSHLLDGCHEAHGGTVEARDRAKKTTARVSAAHHAGVAGRLAMRCEFGALAAEEEAALLPLDAEWRPTATRLAHAARELARAAGLAASEAMEAMRNKPLGGLASELAPLRDARVA